MDKTLVYFFIILAVLVRGSSDVCLGEANRYRTHHSEKHTGLFLHSGIGLSQGGLVQLLIHIILRNQCICGRHWINSTLAK